MKIIKIPVLECQRCGHNWTPRGEKGREKGEAVKYINAEVIMCPACKTLHWDKPRKETTNNIW
jgi:Zn-finger nucleic acid-binding protein